MPSNGKVVDTWSASEFNKVASFSYSAEITAQVIMLLNPKPGDKIVDFGCGSGEITLRLSKAVTDAGIVVGVDSSQSMIDKAKENGLENAYVQDIQGLNDEFASELLARHGQFDKVFSNGVIHLCKRDPVGVIRGVKKVLKPDGFFAAEFGGWGSCFGIRSALHSVLRRRGYDPVLRDPWYFPSTESYSKLLVSEGFEVVDISLTPRQTVFVEPPLELIRLSAMTTSFLQGIDPEETEVILKEVADTFEIDSKDMDSDRWMLMYARLRVLAKLTK